MKVFKGLGFELLKESHIDELTQIMKRAFDEDSKRHLNEETGGPDGYDNGDFIRKYGLDKKSTAYRVLLEDKVIGAVIVWINSNKENYLGNIFVDSNLQDKGYGYKIWKFIESEFPDTKKWSTETPGFSKRNHVFYVNKCGFKVVWIKNPGNLHEESYILEKIL